MRQNTMKLVKMTCYARIKTKTLSRKLKSLLDKGLIEIIDNKMVRILDEIALSSIIDHDG